MPVARGEVNDIFAKVKACERISEVDCLTLLRSHDLITLGRMADTVRTRLNGDLAYYIVNCHINYSNICVNKCRFCAFGKSQDEEGAYELSLDEILARARQGLEDPITEFHIVGGLHPVLPYRFYLDMLRGLKELAPDVHIQAFTAVEIAHLAEMSGKSVADVLTELRECGLGSLPGGGAEIFSSEVRSQVCPTKLSAEGWLDVMKTAHRLGIRSNATMLYGHVERPEDIVDHLSRLRSLQDETGGFMSFIPLTFHPLNTALEKLPGPSGYSSLKVYAISRIFLDNFPHLKAFWIMLGLKLAQVSLAFGVDDLDGTVKEEKITHMAGAKTPEFLAVSELRRMIVEAGRQPVERNTLYEPVGEECIAE